MDYYVYFDNECADKKCDISTPFSKSILNRLAIIYALLGKIDNLTKYEECDDIKYIIRAIKNESEICDIGASGTALRFLTSYFSIKGKHKIITGTKRLCERPIFELVEILNNLGANINYKKNENFPPLEIQECILNGGKTIRFNNLQTSQYISSLMLIAPYIKGGLVISIPSSSVSLPYILMTKKIMECFGANISYNDGVISIKEEEYKMVDYDVERDWSAASYWYELASINPNFSIRLKDLNPKNSVQGDSILSIIFNKLGVETIQSGNDCIVRNNLRYAERLSINMSDYPDIVPAIVISCLLNNVYFSITGIRHLKYKESDRISALINETQKIGYVVKYEDSDNGTISWNGEKCTIYKKIEFETYNDHRLTMSLAPVVVKYNPIIIKDAINVQKSYKNFWNDLSKFGINKKEIL